VGARGRTEREERGTRSLSTTLASQSLQVGTAFSTGEAAKTVLLFPRGAEKVGVSSGVSFRSEGGKVAEPELSWDV